MRIAVFHNLPSGGAKRTLFDQVSRLATRHQFDLFTQSTADQGYADIRPFMTRTRVFPFTPQRLSRSPFGRANNILRWRELGALEEVGREISQAINGGAYDLVLVNPCLKTLVPACIDRLEIPSVLALHDVFGPCVRRDFRRPYLRRNRLRSVLDLIDPLPELYRRRLEGIRRRGIAASTAVIANSQFTADVIGRGYGCAPAVAYCGIDTRDFRPAPGVVRGPGVLSVGELTPRKGFDFLIESLACIPPAVRPPLKLISNFVDPAERQYISALASDLGVAVAVRTNLGPAELAIEYSEAAACIYAPVAEPFGRVPLEASACATPVVGVNEGGVAETVVAGVTGLLTNRNPAAFAEATMAVLDNPTLARRLGEEGRRQVSERWGWDAAIQQLEGHLTAAASAGRRGSA